jgi:hypothetical protein
VAARSLRLGQRAEYSRDPAPPDPCVRWGSRWPLVSAPARQPDPAHDRAWFTAPVLDPATLESLLRHLQRFQALYESEGIDSLPGPGGDDYCLADLMRLYGMRRYLPPLRAAAIETLYRDMSDADAAALMGTSRSDAAAHTRDGLGNLCKIFANGLWKDGCYDSAGHDTGPRCPTEAPRP